MKVEIFSHLVPESEKIPREYVSKIEEKMEDSISYIPHQQIENNLNFKMNNDKRRLSITGENRKLCCVHKIRKLKA